MVPDITNLDNASAQEIRTSWNIYIYKSYNPHGMSHELIAHHLKYHQCTLVVLNQYPQRTCLRGKGVLHWHATTSCGILTAKGSRKWTFFDVSFLPRGCHFPEHVQPNEHLNPCQYYISMRNGSSVQSDIRIWGITTSPPSKPQAIYHKRQQTHLENCNVLQSMFICSSSRFKTGNLDITQKTSIKQPTVCAVDMSPPWKNHAAIHAGIVDDNRHPVPIIFQIQILVFQIWLLALTFP